MQEGKTREIVTCDKRIPSIGHALLFILMYFGFLLLLVSPYFFIKVPDNFSLWIETLIAPVAFALVLIIGRAWSRRPWGEMLPFTRFWHPALFALVPFTFGLGNLLSEVTYITCAVFPNSSWIERIIEQESNSSYSYAIGAIVIAPLTEEAFYRGFVMNGFLKRYSPLKSVVVSALLFAVYHLNPYKMIGVFVFGLVLGWLRIATGSLWPCAAMHVLNNFLPWTIPGFNIVRTGNFMPLWFDALAVVLLVAGGIPLYRFALSRKVTPSLAPSGSSTSSK